MNIIKQNSKLKELLVVDIVRLDRYLYNNYVRIAIKLIYGLSSSQDFWIHAPF